MNKKSKQVDGINKGECYDQQQIEGLLEGGGILGIQGEHDIHKTADFECTKPAIDHTDDVGVFIL